MAPTEGLLLKQGQVLGKFAPSGQNVPGTTSFDNEAHDAIADLVVKRLVEMGADQSRIIIRTRPGRNGVYISIAERDAVALGIKPNIEIKPNNGPSEGVFNRQLSNWGLDRSNTQAVIYDQNGTVRWGFTY